MVARDASGTFQGRRGYSRGADAAKPAAAPPTLTPLGERTLAGFVQRYGDAQGQAKFTNALQSGMLERAKMEAPSAS